MTTDPKTFFLADGSIDVRRAMAAGRVARGEAFANIFFWRGAKRH